LQKPAGDFSQVWLYTAVAVRIRWYLLIIKFNANVEKNEEADNNL
jgi:hypothetical protein